MDLQKRQKNMVGRGGSYWIPKDIADLVDVRKAYGIGVNKTQEDYTDVFLWAMDEVGNLWEPYVKILPGKPFGGGISDQVDSIITRINNKILIGVIEKCSTNGYRPDFIILDELNGSHNAQGCSTKDERGE